MENTDETIYEIARRGELDPESLTLDEIRQIGMFILSQVGDPIQPVINSNDLN